MRILVTLTLLLFELLIITAHAVPTTEMENTKNDVYVIQESGQPKTTFVVPKPKKPTLREIIYYHIVEKPFGGNAHLERQSNPEPQQIEMDETMRPFTNGHGYQFADTDLHETEHHDTPPESKVEADPKEEEDPTTLAEEVTEEVSTESSTLANSDETTEFTTQPTNHREQRETEKEMSTATPILTTPSEEKKNRIRQRQFLFDRLKERYSANFKKPSSTEKIADVTPTTEKAETTEKPADVKTETEKAEITTIVPSTIASTSTPVPSTTVSAPPAVRSRRSVNYEEIPLAPTLPPLDYSKYPGVRVYTGFQPMYQTTIYPIEPSNEDDLKKAMKFKINDIFATMKPYDDDNRNNDNENNNNDRTNENNGFKNENNYGKKDDNDIRVERNNDGNDIRIVTHKPETKPRTYGMNLSDDHGTVWNNMWRPINYHVGEPVKLYEVNEYEVSTITPVEQDTTTEATTTEATTTTSTTTTTTTTPNPKDTEDIFVDVKKHKHTTTAKPERKREEKDPSEKKEDNETNKGHKEDDKIASKSLLKHKKKPNTTDKPMTNEAKPDLYEQLMTSDKFWKWLAQWTSNYMEVLSDRVKDMVKEEVAKEMKKYENSQQKIPLNPTKDENKTNNITAPVKDEKGSNKTEILPTKDVKDANKTETVTKEEPVIKNNTLIVDGKEIPITNTTNFNQGNDTVRNNFLRKHRDENKRPNNKNKLPTNDKKGNDDKNNTLSNEVQTNATKHEENYNHVNAHNVYGSATGNDKVTNIFIFYPGTEAEKIIDGLKPYLNNSVTGIATAIKDDKKSGKEDKKDDKVTEKPIESTSLASKEPENVTTQKPEQNKTEESKPVADKNSTKLDTKKEPITNSTEAKTPETQNKKETTTEKGTDTTEKTTEKGETSSPTETPKSNNTVTSTEKTVDSTTVTSTSTLAPINSTSIAPTEANSTTLAPNAETTSSTAPTTATP